MTFYRHFIERNDFQILVATNSRQIEEYALSYRPVRFATPTWWRRLERTRFAPWVYGMEYLFGGHLLPNSVIRAAKKFHPNVVFTMAGSWDWTALAAQDVARRLRVPLAASFNDWFDYGLFPPHSLLRPKVEARFRRFYRECDLALCTSEGMRDALGAHPNAHVLYPTGAPMPKGEDGYVPDRPRPDRPFSVFFGGSLGDWYGAMLESLVKHFRGAGSEVHFRIFGDLEAWSGAFDNWARREGIFGGHVPFARLADEAAQSDLLLLPMGFGETCAQVERTSFKTKFLDYLSFRRPILVWGPEYCTAVKIARQYDSAECVTAAGPDCCAAAIEQLAANPERRAQLIANARRMYEERFHPAKIHAGLVERMRDLCDGRERCRRKRGVEKAMT